jgi:RNA polymerase sigma factor (sigma-70 family)
MNKNELIEQNMSLVYHLIRRYYPRLIGDEDIVQCGMLGLVQAANSYDPERGAFSTYASSKILGNIKSEIRSRMKHNGVLSLDYEITDDDGGTVTLGDLCVGDSGIDCVDFESFYHTLTPRQQSIVDLRQRGLCVEEIADVLGISNATVNQQLRKVNAKWRITNDG